MAKKKSWKKFAEWYVKYHSKEIRQEYSDEAFTVAGPLKFVEWMKGKSKEEIIWKLHIRDQCMASIAKKQYTGSY